MRRIWVLLIGLWIVNLTAAQADVWSIWVYDADVGRAVQVENSGALLEDVTLPIPAPFITYRLSENISISPNGERIAYHITGLDDESRQISTFIVYDTSTDSILFSYNSSTYAIISSLTFSAVAWNTTGNIVVYAYATGDTMETQSWHLVVFNAFDGRVISEQAPTSPYFAIQSDALAPYLLPVVQFYGEATVGFSLIPYQTLDFSTELPSYEWDIVTGRITLTNRAPRISGDTLTNTAETITPITDERVNYDSQYAPYTNAIHVYRPEIGARVPFFATQTYDILEAHFSQNGEQVTALAQDLISLEFVRLQINRIGISRILPNINAIDNRTIGTPTGFAYIIDNETPFLIAVDTRDDTFPQNPLWSAPQGTRFVPIWASTLPQEDYDAWLQLAPPVFQSQVIVTEPESEGVDPQAVASVTPIGSSGGVITINTVAVVNTTAGDRLNMRSQPGLSSNIIARVDSGTRVVVTDGPVAEDGFTWWEVRLPTGQIGWVVERADGVQTLIPTS